MLFIQFLLLRLPYPFDKTYKPTHPPAACRMLSHLLPFTFYLLPNLNVGSDSSTL